GNTDVDPSVHTRSSTHDAMERELLPYRTTVASVNASPAFPLFGTMISHAIYPVIDESNAPATLSPVILEDLLRGDGTHGATPFDGIHFQGVTVSDAFWTWGATKNLDGMGKRRLMLQSFLAGMDMLMIAHADFLAAWDYFQAAYASQLPAVEQTALLQATHLESWDALHAKLALRVDESAARIHAAKSLVGSSLQFAGTGPADAHSADLVREYRALAR
ncbi:MAG TPA: glycoside hydrolase family 3 N-terminal domain-containing protein, partial [Labilithrix sp.]